MKLELYMFDSCPYCQRVMRTIHKLKVPVEMHNIHVNAQDRQRLIDVGGKSQVPCLFIDGKPLYESADIIAWLEENAAV